MTPAEEALRQALLDHAAAVVPRPDPPALEARLHHADVVARLRLIAIAGLATAVLLAAVTAGVLHRGGDDVTAAGPPVSAVGNRTGTPGTDPDTGQPIVLNPLGTEPTSTAEGPGDPRDGDPTATDPDQPGGPGGPTTGPTTPSGPTTSTAPGGPTGPGDPTASTTAPPPTEPGAPPTTTGFLPGPPTTAAPTTTSPPTTSGPTVAPTTSTTVRQLPCRASFVEVPSRSPSQGTIHLTVTGPTPGGVVVDRPDYVERVVGIFDSSGHWEGDTTTFATFGKTFTFPVVCSDKTVLTLTYRRTA